MNFLKKAPRREFLLGLYSSLTSGNYLEILQEAFFMLAKPLTLPKIKKKNLQVFKGRSRKRADLLVRSNLLGIPCIPLCKALPRYSKTDPKFKFGEYSKDGSNLRRFPGSLGSFQGDLKAV